MNHIHKFKEIDTGWDFDNKYNWIVEECSCGKIREITSEGNWEYR